MLRDLSLTSPAPWLPAHPPWREPYSSPLPFLSVSFAFVDFTTMAGQDRGPGPDRGCDETAAETGSIRGRPWGKGQQAEARRSATDNPGT